MKSWAIFFTAWIDIAGVLPIQGFNQDGLTEGHHHHHHEHNKEAHGHFSEAVEAGEASEDDVAEGASDCILIKAKSL